MSLSKNQAPEGVHQPEGQQTSEYEASESNEQLLTKARLALELFKSEDIFAALDAAVASGKNPPPEIMAKIKSLNIEADVAYATFLSQTKVSTAGKAGRKINKVLPQAIRKYTEPYIAEKDVDAARKYLSEYTRSGSPEDFPKAFEVYERVRDSLESWRSIQEGFGAKAATYIENQLPKTGLKAGLLVYSELPEELLSARSFERVAHALYTQAKKETTNAANGEFADDTEYKAAIHKHFENYPELILVGPASDWYNYLTKEYPIPGAKVAAIKNLYNKPHGARKLLGVIKPWQLTSEELQEVTAELFDVYKERRETADEIFLNFDIFAEQFHALPVHEQQQIIDGQIAYGRDYALLKCADRLTFTEEQWKNLREYSTRQPYQFWENYPHNTSLWNNEELNLFAEQSIEHSISARRELFKALAHNPPISAEIRLSLIEALTKEERKYFSEIWDDYKIVCAHLRPEENDRIMKAAFKHFDAISVLSRTYKEPKVQLTHEGMTDVLTIAIEKNEYSRVLDSWNEIAIPPESISLLAGRMYAKALSNESYNYIEKINYTTGIPFKYEGEIKSEITSSLALTAPAEYQNKKASIQRFIAGEDLETPAWDNWWTKIEKLQARTSRTEYDPWINQLNPLFKQTCGTEAGKILNVESPKDGEILYSYIHEYGMHNMPTILRWHAAIKRAKEISDMPEDIRKEINSSLGIECEKLSNKGFIGKEIKRFKIRIINELLEDKIPAGVETAAGQEFQESVTGGTRWKRNDSYGKLLEQWKETVERDPEITTLPKGFKTTTLEVPLAIRNPESEAERRERTEKERTIANNPKVRQAVQEIAYDWPLEKTSKLGWEQIWQAIKEEILDNIHNRPDRSLQPNTTSEGLEAVLQNIPTPPAQDNSEEKRDITGWLAEVTTAIENSNLRSEYKDTIIRRISAAHMEELAGGAFNGLAQDIQSMYRSHNDENIETVTLKAQELISGYIQEHYLNENQDAHITGHAPLPDLTLNSLRRAWKVDNEHPTITAGNEIRALRRAAKKASEKTKPITLVPVRGLLRIKSGDIGDACYTSRHEELAKGEHKNLTAFIYVTGYGTENVRFGGSVLAIETKNPQTQEKVLLVRANNPRENLLGQFDSDSLTRLTLEELQKQGALSEMKRIAVPLDGSSQASSNRPPVSGYYRDQFGLAKRIPLEESSETKFNGYDVHNEHGNHPAVDITTALEKISQN